MVKQFMADDDLSQKPLLVAPYTMRASVLHYFAEINKEGMLRDRKNRSKDRCESLRKLAKFLKEYGTIYEKAIDYYSHLISNELGKVPPVLEFLKHGRQIDISESFAYDKKPDESFIPHKLQVNFPRAERTLE